MRQILNFIDKLQIATHVVLQGYQGLPSSESEVVIRPQLRPKRRDHSTCARLEERTLAMHEWLLPEQAWWDAQRFDQPQWQVDAWRDQKVRHIHLHVAKALGKVVAMLDEAARPDADSACVARVRSEALPDVAIYRSQLINLLPEGLLPEGLLPEGWSQRSLLSQASSDGGGQGDATLWFVALGLSRASAALATYLEPREHGESSCASYLIRAIEHLHASAIALAAWFGVDLPRAHWARLEALGGASAPASPTD